MVSVTATIGTIAFTETERARATEMPMSNHYYGMGGFHLKELRDEDLEAESASDLPTGIVQMVEDMLADDGGRVRVGLIHGGKIRQELHMDHSIRWVRRTVRCGCRWA